MAADGVVAASATLASSGKDLIMRGGTKLATGKIDDIKDFFSKAGIMRPMALLLSFIFGAIILLAIVRTFAGRRKDLAMGSGNERVKGKFEEVKGAVKERVGDLIDNDRMEAEGHADKVKGQARQNVAKTSERVRGMGEELRGKVKGTVGDLIGNEQMELEGKVDELKGKGRQKANQ